MPLTDEEKAKILSGNLVHPLVQQLLAGFLHQALRASSGAIVTPELLEEWLRGFAERLPQLLDQAVKLYDSGVRPRNPSKLH